MKARKLRRRVVQSRGRISVVIEKRPFRRVIPLDEIMVRLIDRIVCIGITVQLVKYVLRH
jgi:hypothetical protein